MMRNASLIAVSLFAIVLFTGICTPVLAGEVTFVDGIVDEDGGGVTLFDREGTNVVPSNLAGLLKSGQIAPLDEVTVRIVSDKGRNKHRGHVTVLK